KQPKLPKKKAGCEGEKEKIIGDNLCQKKIINVVAAVITVLSKHYYESNTKGIGLYND
ncbi:MAG: hypothetical protein Q616_SPPC00170G0002, partial [Streptococcus parasanguinis DORA_23_24]